MRSPKISVIVPVYNAGRRLARCVESILTQTYTDFELLLVDDGSTDGSGAVCNEYAGRDPRVRVFYKPNGGVGSARNLGLRFARGEWVTFVDADDMPYCSWLENYGIEENCGYDLISQGVEASASLFGENGAGRLLAFNYDGTASGLLREFCNRKCVGYAWHKIYRMSIIREHHLKFDVNIKLKEDELFVFEYMAHVQKAKSVAKIGYWYDVPDWNRKYNLSSEENIYYYERLNALINATHSYADLGSYERYVRQELTTAYMHEVRDKFSRSALKKIRSHHLRNHHFSNLNRVSRNLLIYDLTLILSGFVIWCQMRIRKTIGI